MIDAARLEAWLDSKGIGLGPVANVCALAGGTQNLLLSFDRGDQGLVLRRPPESSGPAGDATMHREAAVLAALAHTAVPHPRFLAAEPSPDVFGRAFYVMSRVDGYSVVTEAPARGSSAAMVTALAASLGSLAAIDPAAVGLTGIGRPEGFLERQTARWLRQLESYMDVPGYEPRGLGQAQEIGRWLDANLPPPQPPGIVHGDLHLGNVLFSRGAPGVAALLDWELTTMGDPVVDLAELIVTWPDENGRSILGPVATPCEGTVLPGASELVATYANVANRDLEHLHWYCVLAGFRLGIILEGSRARAVGGTGSVSVGDELHDAAVRLLDQAQQRIS